MARGNKHRGKMMMVIIIKKMMKSRRKNSTDLNRPSVFSSNVLPSVQQKRPTTERNTAKFRDTSYQYKEKMQNILGGGRSKCYLTEKLTIKAKYSISVIQVYAPRQFIYPERKKLY